MQSDPAQVVVATNDARCSVNDPAVTGPVAAPKLPRSSSAPPPAAASGGPPPVDAAPPVGGVPPLEVLPPVARAAPAPADPLPGTPPSDGTPPAADVPPVAETPPPDEVPPAAGASPPGIPCTPAEAPPGALNLASSSPHPTTTNDRTMAADQPVTAATMAPVRSSRKGSDRAFGRIICTIRNGASCERSDRSQPEPHGPSAFVITRVFAGHSRVSCRRL